MVYILRVRYTWYYCKYILLRNLPGMEITDMLYISNNYSNKPSQYFVPMNTLESAWKSRRTYFLNHKLLVGRKTINKFQFPSVYSDFNEEDEIFQKKAEASDGKLNSRLFLPQISLFKFSILAWSQLRSELVVEFTMKDIQRVLHILLSGLKSLCFHSIMLKFTNRNCQIGAMKRKNNLPKIYNNSRIHLFRFSRLSKHFQCNFC